MTKDLDIENPENIKFGLLNLEILLDEAYTDAINYFNKQCPYCGKNLFSDNIRKKKEKDHFIPIERGGQDFPWNRLPVCHECNRKKQHKMPYDFLPEPIYNKCKQYLNSVLLKYTNQHEDYLQMAKLVDYFVKQHSESKINDNELIENLYQIYGIEIKKKVEPQIEIIEDTTSNNKHINFLWEALKQIKKHNKRNYFIKDDYEQIIYVKLNECKEVYRKYCKDIGEEPILYADLLKLLTQSNYKPFIEGRQKGRKYSINKAGLGSCYRFQYERTSNVNTIKIGDKEIEL